MSKKVVIVPKHKWTIVEEFESGIHEGQSNIFFRNRKSRQDARDSNTFIGGTVRKVTKIVYYYE